MTDRRSGNERREVERYKVTVDIEWENHVGRYPGTLSDISERGCFVLAAGDFADGERVFVFVTLPEGGELRLAGEITNHVFEIGFAATFIDVSGSDLDTLRSLIDHLKGNVETP